MKFKTIYLIAAAFMVMALAACKKELTKVNTSPTSIPAANYDPNFLLTTVQLMYTGSTDFGAENWQTEWGEIAGFIQHISSINTAYYSGDKYLNTVGNFGVYFDHAYIYQVQPVVELYKLTLNKPQYKNLHQIARIMKALVFERITDIYGDVPYSQAGLGYYQRIYAPQYDTQQSIYTDLLKEVSQATDSLDVKADNPTGDAYYYSTGKNQISEWKKFGNSLLLRIAMRLTKVDPATAQSYVTKVQNQTMTSNSDNAVFEHELGSETQNRDSWSIIGEDSTDLKLCNVYIDSLQKNHDPRLHVMAVIFSTNDSTSVDQLGLPQGYVLGGSNPLLNITKTKTYPKKLGMEGYSRFSNTILSYTAPNLILTYAETELLLADAAKRWGIGGDPAVHYKNGLVAAITQLSVYGDDATISEANAEAYAAAHPYNDAIGLSQINTQYWLCTILDEYEAWSNWRRTSNIATNPNGYPALTPTVYPGNVTKGTIPRRLEYPASEKVTNSASYNAAVARLTGGDMLTSRVWWDTQ
jgi:hypothetical protein